jgi:hypothetical protein
MAVKANKTVPERSAFTISEFCARNHITKPTYYKMRAVGLGPDEMRIDDIVRITVAAEARWQRARENPKGKEAEAVRASAKRLRDKAQAAAANSVSKRAGVT